MAERTMEKKYVAFHTASGCLVAVAGLTVVSVGLVLFFFLLPNIWWIQLPIAFILYYGVFWLAFRVDSESLRRGKNSHGDIT